MAQRSNNRSNKQTNPAVPELEEQVAEYQEQFEALTAAQQQEVVEAINTKNVMQQAALTAQNELQKNEFQARGDSIKAAGRAKAILTEAEAQAKANELLSRSITPTLVQYEMSKRWNGQMPQVAGSAMPMIQLPGAK